MDAMEVDEEPFATCRTSIHDDLSERCDSQDMLDCTKAMKERHSGGSEYHSTNEDIPIDQFSQSLRTLEMACCSQQPLRVKAKPQSQLNFVSFGDLLRTSSSESKFSEKNCSRLSFDEDNEEDMFSDTRDEDNDRSREETFHGFSNNESERSKSIALKCSQRQIDEELEPKMESFLGFTSLEKELCLKAEKTWFHLLQKYEIEVAMEIRTKRFESRINDPPGVDCLPRIRELKNLDRPKSGDKRSERKRSVEKIEQPNDVFPRDSTPGFVTARGKKINVSETALARAKKMYEEVSILEPEKETINDVVSKVEATTEKSRATFDEMEDEIIQNLIEPNSFTQEISVQESRPTPQKNVKMRKEELTLGFTTARGGELKISKESLLKAEAQYNEIEKEMKENNRNENLQDDKKKSVKKSESGFMTAKGRKLTISKEALSKAQAQFNEIQEEYKENFSSRNLDDNSKKDKNFGSGFTTASGRELKISKEALSKAQAQFNEIREEFKENVSSRNLDDNSKKDENFGSGFTTANGRELKISKEALSKAQAQFNEIREEFKENVSSRNLDDNSKKDENFGSGFTTASGRELKISKEALSKAQAQFNEIREEFKENISSRNLDDNSKKDENFGSGFTTASGRELKISKEALSKAQAQFEKLSQEVKENLSQEVKENLIPVKIKAITERKSSLSSGFTTAGGRELRISQEALSQAKAQFHEIEREVTDSSVKINSPVIVEASKSGEDSNREPAVEDNFDSLEFDDLTVDECENARKRTFDEIDDDTPIRRDSQGKRKKGRYVSDLQGRKLFEEEELALSSWESRAKTSDESPKVQISAEVVASAAALLEDEEKSNGVTESKMEVDQVQEETKISTPRRNSKFSDIIGESIPDDLNFDSQFSEEFHHDQIINKFIMETMKTMEARLSMISKQDETIRMKMRNRPKACDGYLYQLRNFNRDSRISWRELTEGNPPTPRENSSFLLDSGILSVTANTASSFTFSCADFYGGKNVEINVEGITVGDGALLILDERNCAGVREFERAFLASPGVNPNLVPKGWIKNHYRWIVWKLASMDRMKFGTKFLSRMLTPNRVMLELKYRYDREINRAQWPPLRRILEKNEDARARLVLCVASIDMEDELKTPARRSSGTPVSIDSPMLKITLTDGWYSIPATVDLAMISCVRSGKIKEGTKLITCGASVVNLDQGCSVLEIPDSVTLKIHTNSTRRVRWDTKLDFYHRNRGPMALSLRSVKSHGGAICKMVVTVARSYPILYREKLPDGQFISRNARCEEEAAHAHEARCQAKMEEICEKARADLSIGSKNNCNEDEIRRRISITMKECLPPPRDVTSLLNIRVADGDTSAMMTIWSANTEDDRVFEEGTSLAIYNCVASGQRCNELRLTAGRNTIFDKDARRHVPYPERIFTSLMEVGETGFNPVYSEFDTIGIVTSIGAAPHGMKNFETVNLACPRFEDEGTSDFLSILFWQGVSTHGYSKILTRGTLIACSNLEWRRNTARSIPTAYSTERSIFTRNPRQKHLAEPLEKLRVLIKDPLAYAAKSATIIQEEIARKTSLRTPENGTPYRTLNNSTPSPGEFGTSGANFTPDNNSRKASIMRRIEKLKMYGEPPRLPSMSALPSSPKVNAEFRSPILTPVNKKNLE